MLRLVCPLLWGIITWTLNKGIPNKIDAFEMWVYRRKLKILWVGKVTNAEVPTRMNKERGILTIIKQRKLE